MTKSAYIGLASLLVLMLLIAFGFKSVFKSSAPLDANPQLSTSGTNTTGSGGETEGTAVESHAPETLTDISALSPTPGRSAAEASSSLINPLPPEGGTTRLISGDAGLTAHPPIAETTTPAGSLRHTIVVGDTFSKLAKQYYGSDATVYVDAILKANPDKNPKLLRVNDVVIIPPKPAGASGSSAPTPPGVRVPLTPTPAPGSTALSTPTPSSASATGTTGATKDLTGYKTYVVKQGDTFAKIARTMLGSAGKANQLFELNKKLGLVDDPTKLKAGQTIVLGKASN